MTIIFAILALMTIAGMTAAMSLRHLIHCVLALTVGFVGLAMLYLQLNAQFVGFTQILVYVGGVAILAVFAIMTTQSREPVSRPGSTPYWVTGTIVAAGVFGVLAWAIGRSGMGGRVLPPPAEVPARQIGFALMQGYVLPLEIMGLLLTAALIGAVVVATNGKQVSR
jgi:NADH-quinone oxidoreductase subunit J